MGRARGLANPGGPRDEDIEVFFDPLADGQRLDQEFIQASGMAIVDVFEGRIVLEPGPAQTTGQATVFPLRHLPVNQQSETLFEGQFLDVRHLHLLGQGNGHAGKFQCLELVQGGMCQHVILLVCQW